MNQKEKVIVLLSGGLDSTVCLWLMKEKDFELYTTGKINQSNEYSNKEAGDTPNSRTFIENQIDSKPQISPKQIASGVGVIFFIILLLFRRSRRLLKKVIKLVLLLLFITFITFYYFKFSVK